MTLLLLCRFILLTRSKPHQKESEGTACFLLCFFSYTHGFVCVLNVSKGMSFLCRKVVFMAEPSGHCTTGKNKGKGLKDEKGR